MSITRTFKLYNSYNVCVIFRVTTSGEGCTEAGSGATVDGHNGISLAIMCLTVVTPRDTYYSCMIAHKVVVKHLYSLIVSTNFSHGTLAALLMVAMEAVKSKVHGLSVNEYNVNSCVRRYRQTTWWHPAV